MATYTVRWLNKDATDVLKSVTVEAGTDATSLAPTPPEIEGYTFTGWNADVSNVQEDMTVRPIYTPVYTVTFMNYAGTAALSTQTVTQGGSATAPTPETIAHMNFTGWDTDYTNVQSDLTIHPLYEYEKFLVRFLNYAGTDVLSSQNVAYGSSAVAPTPERITDMIFLGWNAPFTKVTESLTIRPLYRLVPPNPRLQFYSVNADGSSGSLIKTYNGVNACTITQKLDGECTISVKLLTRQSEGYVDVNNRLEVDGLVFNVTEIKKSISGGMCYTEFVGEHVSFILNNDEYKVDAFEMTGTPQAILETLLSGTPFTIGTVDPTDKVTIMVNKECTRRAVVMQLIALVGGEIEYYGYTIGIRSHVGKTDRTAIMDTAIVQDLSYSFNNSEQTTNYDLSLYKKGSLELGDELTIVFKPMGINTESRIVGMEWNPFNYKEVQITVGAYIPTLNDSLYGLINEVQDIRETTAKYTVEFGELIGNGSFYFTRAYRDRPYFHIHTSDGSEGTVTLNQKSGSAFGKYVGATLSGVNTETVTLLVFYCTVPADEDEE